MFRHRTFQASSYGLLLIGTMLQPLILGQSSCETDSDGDGWDSGDDCDDSDPNVHPGATEVCDEIDNDCDGSIDEDFSTLQYADTDGDGYGDPDNQISSCSAEAGYVTNDSDCDDDNTAVHPGGSGAECADELDYNCDAIVGQLISSGGSVSVNIPSVSISFSVTLNGQTISSSNTTASDYGSLRLEDVSTGKRSKIYDFYNTTTSSSSGVFTAQVAPGTYDIYYEVVKDGSNWPDNHQALIKSAVNLTNDGSQSLNITTVTVTFAATLNGSSLTSSNTNANEYGTIRLKDTVSGEKFTLWDTFNTTTLAIASSYAPKLLPGTYDIYYAVGKATSSWPKNEDAVLVTARTFSSSTSVTVNVATVGATVNVTLDGAAISSSNSSADDEGNIYLKNTTTGDKFKVFSTWDDSANTAASPTFKVLAGTYDILYSISDDGPHWPANEDYVLKTSQSIASTYTTTVNVSTVDLALTVSLDGQSVSTSNTTADDEGEIRFEDVVTGQNFLVMSTWNDTAGKANGSETVQIIPGTYHVVYGIHDSGTYWPHNEKFKLSSNVTMTADSSISVNVDYAQVTFSVTLGGATVSTSNTGSLDYGTIELYETSNNDKFKAFDVYDASTMKLNVPFTTRVVPGTYDVYYKVEVDGANWPGNDSALIQSGLTISGDSSVAIDVPYSTVTVSVTLDGQSLSSGNTTATDEGSLILKNLMENNSFEGFTTYSDTNSTIYASQPVRMIPGDYTLRYSVQDDGSHWPSNEELDLTCFTTR